MRMHGRRAVERGVHGEGRGEEGAGLDGGVHLVRGGEGRLAADAEAVRGDCATDRRTEGLRLRRERGGREGWWRDRMERG